MGQKVNPTGFRLGYIKGWDSNWFASKKDYAVKLIEDNKIRNYLESRMAHAGVARIVIERTFKRVLITIHTSRPGIIIGKGGAGVDIVREELKHLTEKEIHINVVEIKKPELNAKLIADSMVQQLKARGSYRRVMKQAMAATMRLGVQGIKIKLSGRLGGAEMARSEQYKEGRVPLHTLRALIDYAAVGAPTIYGIIGIKVWVYTGEQYGRLDLAPSSDKRPRGERGRSRRAS